MCLSIWRFLRGEQRPLQPAERADLSSGEAAAPLST
jgi:hypothetical protein